MGDLMFKIYNFINNIEPTDFYTPPYDYNYNILGLYKSRTFEKGLLTKVDYFSEIDTGGTYQNLILTENREYYRKNGMAYLRKMIISWYLEDGSIGGTKKTYKYYTPLEAIKFGERQRSNIVSGLKIDVVGLIMMSSGCTQSVAEENGLYFLKQITEDVTQYIEGYEEQLRNSILTFSDDNTQWLDLEIPNTGGITIRQYLYNGVVIDYTANEFTEDVID